MNAVAGVQTYVFRARLDTALRAIRNALAEMELDVAGQLDAAEIFNPGAARTAGNARILLVDCPLLDFEALALDRASAVFFPLHILVSAIGDVTEVSVMNPTSLFDARLPVGAANPIERLLARVTIALESALLKPGESSLKNG